MVSTRIAQLWTCGVCAGDAERLAGPAASPRAELAMFAALAALLADRTPVVPRIAGDAPVRALGHVVIAWRAIRARDGATAAGELAAIDAALLEAAGDPRLAAAQAWADLVMAEAAEAIGDRATWRRRLDVILAARGAPAGVRVAAGMRRARRVEPHERAALVAALDAAAHAARIAGAPEIAAEAALHAGLVLIGHDAPAALSRFANVARDARGAPAMIARLVVAQATADEPQVVLADGLRRAASGGDYLAYLVFALQGARRYEQTGRTGDALFTLSATIAHLERAGDPALASPLIAARDRLRQRLGSVAYAQAAQAALARLA